MIIEQTAEQSKAVEQRYKRDQSHVYFSLYSHAYHVRISISTPPPHSPHTMSGAISWSKNGFITYAEPRSEASHNVCLTYLENTNGHHWQLARPTTLTVKLSESTSIPTIDTLRWSNLLTDLAVWDEHGNFYILLTGVGLINNNNKNKSEKEESPDGGPLYELTSYNHTEMIYRDIVAPQAHTQCVAFEWLGVEKPVIVNKPARLVESSLSGSQNPSYQYEVQQHHFTGTTHPIPTKQACVALRQNGLVNLYYQGEHKVEYHKTSVNLAPDGVEGSVSFTKASIGFAAGAIIVCAYDARSNQIITYSLTVDWGFLVHSARQQKDDPHFHTPKDIQLQHPPSITCSVISSMRPLNSVEAGGSSDSVATASLSLIHVFSPYHYPDSTTDILVTYHCCHPVSSAPFTKILRYNLRSAGDFIGDLFDKIDSADSDPSEKPSSSPNHQHNHNSHQQLVLRDWLAVPAQLRLINRSYADGLLFFVYADGSVDAIDRATYSRKQPSAVKTEGENPVVNLPEIASLLDCGFMIPQLPPSAQALAISPNLAAIVYLQNGMLQFAPFELPQSQRSNYTSCGLGFAYMHASACYANICLDDLMVLLKSEMDLLQETNPDLVPKLVDFVIAESHRSINFKLNSFGKESVDKLLSNPPLQKLLSVQLLLGDSLPTNDSTAIRDMAWIVLNLRSTSFGIMFSLSSIYRQMSKKKPHEDSLADSMSRAECIMLLIGNVKWLIDLIVYLNQELLNLAFTKSRQSFSKVSMQNSVVLPIILGKVPRLFLMYALSSIGKTHEILKKIYKDLSESNKLYTPMKEALNRFFTVCNSLPSNLGLFENFLRECELYVNKELAAIISADKARQLHLEQELFCRGVIPVEMVPIANALIERHSATISRELKLSDLYFYENNWVDVGIARLPLFDHHSNSHHHHHHNQMDVDSPIHLPMVPRLQYSENEFVDALRKIIIPAPPTIKSGGSSAMGQGYDLTNMLKKCTRCRAVSLVADPSVFDSPHGLGLWTMVFQRTCICGSAWVNCT